jgi:metallo-beta-lactamase class B
MRCRCLLLILLTALLDAQQRVEWNIPQKPFKIYGNTYYVGTHGLSSVLITSATGHVLIDGALPESVPHIVDNIRALGFRVEDIKLIVNSHVHYDHAGGIAELQRLSGARVAASPWTAAVMKTGAVPRDDPQFGVIGPIAKVAHAETISDKETLHAGAVDVTAHFTPGHTPGGTSWTWKSCENIRCLNLVYADSLTPVSADGFLFSLNHVTFEPSYTFLESTPCDILITPHPGPANGSIDPTACRTLAATSREMLQKRLATERLRQ